MSAVIIAVHGETRGYQNFDRSDIPPDMLAHTMRDLDDAAPGASATPDMGSDLLTCLRWVGVGSRGPFFCVG